MIGSVLLSMAVVFGALGGWVVIQHLARRFAVRHPEFGFPREEGEGCGPACRCPGGDGCPKPWVGTRNRDLITEETT